jgi:hypothetical protein
MRSKAFTTFEHLAADRRFERLAQLNRAARQRPLSLERSLRAPDEQHLLPPTGIPSNDHRAHARYRSVRIFTPHRSRVQGARIGIRV